MSCPLFGRTRVVDPFFGAVVFVGVLTIDEDVEIVSFEQDPDYWRLLGEIEQ